MARQLTKQEVSQLFMGKLEEKVRCCDCQNQDKIMPNHSRLGPSQHNKFCPVPVNGEVLVNGMNNDQALRAWRRCECFVWNGEKEA